MEDQSQSIMKDMEETRTHLTEKLEALENQVAEKVQPVAAAVERATEAAAEIVENVKETVHNVTDKVEEAVHTVTDKVEATVNRVSSVFNLSEQTRHYPWVTLGLALTAGCMFGTTLARRSRLGWQEALASAGPAPKHSKGFGNGKTHHRAESESERRGRRSEPARREGWFSEELGRLKELALGALMGALRDLTRQSIPGVVGARLADEIDRVTARFGAQPIREPVLREEAAPRRETRKEQSESPVAPGTEANRLPPNGFRS